MHHARSCMWQHPRKVLASLFSLLTLAAFAGASAPIHAAEWPSKPVRVVVPYAPGGIADIAARAVSQKMAAQTGQAFIVENRPGADTRIGTEYVSRAQGDDHVLLLAGGGFAVNNSLFKTLPYDTTRDFVPVGLVVSNPLLLVTGKDQPYKTVGEIVDAARSGKPVTLASGGRGTLSHMSMELLASSTSVLITHVPYKGGSAHTADVVSGLVTGIFENPSSALPLVRGDKYRPIAVTGSRRSTALPDVPTVAESGVKDFEVINWFGLFAPAGIPDASVTAMAAELKEALSADDLRKRFADDGVDVGGPMRADFGAFVADETQKWSAIVESRKIRGDE